MPEACLDALLEAHSGDRVPELAALCHALGTTGTPRVTRFADGFALDCCNRGLADAFVAVRHSRLLKRSFATLLVASHGVPMHDSVAETLSKVYQKWDSLHNEPRSCEEHHVSVQRGAGVERVAVPDAVFDKLRRQLAVAGRTEVALAGGVALRLTVRDKVCLQLRDVCYDVVHHGPFASAVEHKIDGTHVHGVRALLGALFAEAPLGTPVVTLATPPYTANCDSLVRAARAMRLSSPYAARGVSSTELFRMLGVAVQPLEAAAGGGVSVFALPLQHTAVMPLHCVHTLARCARGSETLRPETGAAALGAFAAFTQFALLGAPRPRRPVMLNLPLHIGGNAGVLARTWRDGAVEAVARLPVPLFALEWHGQEVSVRAVRVLGSLAVVFSDEKGVFAVAGRPRLAAKGVRYPHTPFCAALSAVNDTPPAAYQSGLRAAALRLAQLDALACGFPQFSAHARQLRALWLHTEQMALRAALPNDAEFCTACGALSQLARLPLGCNFWATVPLLP